MTSAVQEQYEKWPYPSVPRIAKIPREHLWQLNLNWIRSRCGFAPLKTSPRIWIAGCGTFEPYVFSLANPDAQIISTDLSIKSLTQAKKRLHWHGLKNNTLRQVDLTQPDQFPDGAFDFIECYGVLMCLPNPMETLRNLASKLKPDGVLRIMVYPHYGRQRVFQIQRLAKLLGLDYRQPNSPALLRKLFRKIPPTHPLSYAFSSYWDARNLPGIVDGFLHASDRGFTGIELCHMIDQAGLTPRFCFHRPWGQPSQMAEKLSGLGRYPFAFWLHYLDLWQSLRTNFTLCLTKKEVETDLSTDFERHPLFDFKNPSLGFSYKSKLLKMAITGARLPSRTGEEAIHLRADEVKQLLRGQLKNSEILLAPHEEKWKSDFNPKWESIRPQKHFILRSGNKLLNPLFDYLFDAYTFDQATSVQWEQPLPNLRTQIKLWENEAYSLENEVIPFGLTPYGTYIQRSSEVDDYLEPFLNAEEISFNDFTLPRETAAFNSLHDFLKNNGFSNLPNDSASCLRQLWILLFSFEQLFIKP